MNPADIAFIIICTGLVMLMTPGLALFYGGLVRSRNVLSTTMHSFITMGIVPVLWFVVGYSLAFGPDLGGIIGGFSHVLLRGVDMEGAGAASGIPPLLFMLFQCMFAVLTLALISGSYAERIHFPAMLLFFRTVAFRVLPHGPLGVGRRLDDQDGRCGLRGRSGGSHSLGGGRPRGGTDTWSPAGSGQKIFCTA